MTPEEKETVRRQLMLEYHRRVEEARKSINEELGREYEIRTQGDRFGRFVNRTYDAIRRYEDATRTGDFSGFVPRPTVKGHEIKIMIPGAEYRH